MNRQEKNNRNLQEPTTNNKEFSILLFIVFILPWPHGGELVWQYFIFCISIFSLSAIYFINKINNKNIEFSILKSIKIPLVLIGTWLFFQVLQVLPLPINLSNVAEQPLNTNNWQTISIATNVTLIEIIKHTSYIIMFILTLLLLNTKQRVLMLANTLFTSSTIIAIYSLVNHYTNGSFSLISSIPPWTASWEKVAHGTFSYQNHYASFLTLTIPLGYGLIYANIKKSSYKNNDKSLLEKTLNLLMSINGLYLLSLLVMTIALFKTASRGGNLIFTISITLTFFCVLLQENKSKKKKMKKAVLLTMCMIVIGLLVTLTGVTDSLIKRVNSEGYNPNGRALMYQSALKIIKQRPVTGTGAGTYPVLQHKYKAPELGRTAMSKRAHNDYLELLTNQGVIGFSLLGTAMLLLYIRLLMSLKKNRSNYTSSLHGMKTACFCSVTAILLHSLVDFNFHLPANAVYFYLILALGVQSNMLNFNTKKKKPNNLLGY
jgi:O-antigen ligase